MRIYEAEVTVDQWDDRPSMFKRKYDPYFIYHIPGDKVGITNSLEHRVEKAQGYKPGEYEVLHTINNIFIASFVEMQEQKQRGYAVESQPYYKLFTKKGKEMKRTLATFKTTGLYCKNVEDLDKFINGNIVFDTPSHGKLVFDTPKKIQWIIDNIHISFKHKENPNIAPLFIYNKAAYEFLQSYTECSVVGNCKPKIADRTTSLDDLNDFITQWHYDAGIIDQSTQMHQAFKIAEEYGELAKAIIKDEGLDKIEDALGDMFVVMVSVAILSGTDIRKCIADAYNEIAPRLEHGGMVGGDFRKNLKAGKDAVSK